MSQTSSRTDEHGLLEALRAGNQAAFADVVDAYGPMMRRVALNYVRSAAVADEVVQEAWIGALRGLDRFEGRAAIKTWLFRIVANVAKTHATREARTISFSPLDLELEAQKEYEPAVAPGQFQGPEGQFPRGWITFPAPWNPDPARALEGSETRRLIDEAVAGLPDGQRLVFTMRDVEGWSAEEVCSVLELSETNQRVLLHRARAKVRAALDEYLIQEET